MRVQVAAAAADYLSWGRVDDLARLAPTLCRRPPPPTARSSAAHAAAHSDVPSHAQKLYFLYARDPSAYRGLESGADQGDQVLVKEAHAAVPYEMPGPGRVPEHVVQTAQGPMTPGALDGLFVMLRTEPAAGGEAAWRYATVTHEGTITAAGRVSSCIDCHARAPFSGLFGLGR